MFKSLIIAATFYRNNLSNRVDITNDIHAKSFRVLVANRINRTRTCRRQICLRFEILSTPLGGVRSNLCREAGRDKEKEREREEKRKRKKTILARHATWRVNGIANVSYINRDPLVKTLETLEAGTSGPRATELSDRWQSSSEWREGVFHRDHWELIAEYRAKQAPYLPVGTAETFW